MLNEANFNRMVQDARNIVSAYQHYGTHQVSTTDYLLACMILILSGERSFQHEA